MAWTLSARARLFKARLVYWIVFVGFIAMATAVSFFIFSTRETDRHKILSLTLDPLTVRTCDPITIVYRTWRTERSSSTTTRYFFRLPEIEQIHSITNIGSYNQRTPPEGLVGRTRLAMPCLPPGDYRMYTTIVDHYPDGKTEIVGGPAVNFKITGK